jgi:hypothetical protein
MNRQPITRGRLLPIAGACALIWGHGRQALAADEKPDFAQAICNIIGGETITEKVRGLYYNKCICPTNSVGRPALSTGQKVPLFERAEQDGTQNIVCTARTQQPKPDGTGDYITYKDTNTDVPKFMLTGEADIACYSPQKQPNGTVCGTDAFYEFGINVAVKGGGLAYEGGASAQFTVNVGAGIGANTKLGPAPVADPKCPPSQQTLQPVPDPNNFCEVGRFTKDDTNTAAGAQNPPVKYVANSCTGGFVQYAGFTLVLNAEVKARLNAAYANFSADVHAYCRNNAVNVGFVVIGQETVDRKCRTPCPSVSPKPAPKP